MGFKARALNPHSALGTQEQLLLAESLPDASTPLGPGASLPESGIVHPCSTARAVEAGKSGIEALVSGTARARGCLPDPEVCAPRTLLHTLSGTSSVSGSSAAPPNTQGTGRPDWPFEAAGGRSTRLRGPCRKTRAWGGVEKAQAGCRRTGTGTQVHGRFPRSPS